MLSAELANPRHVPKQIQNFKGLLTNLTDYRQLPPGYLSIAQDVVYDAQGNVRPRDGYEQWWPNPLPQRFQAFDAELAENAQWDANSSAATSPVFNGFQSRLLSVNVSSNKTTVWTPIVPLNTTAVLKANTNGWKTALWIAFYSTNKANMVGVTVTVVTSQGSVVTGIPINSLQDNAWVVLNCGAHAYIAGETVNSISINVANGSGGGSTLNIDDGYFAVQFTGGALYAADSYCSGLYEFRKVSNPNRYLMAMFGETLYADLNEAKAPFKIQSRFTRGIPAYFEANENRVIAVNGTDSNFVWTGTMYRNAGYPAPSSDPTLATHAGTELLIAPYYYGVTFVYGEGAILHGESSMRQDATPITTTGGNQEVSLSAIPVGALDSGVVQRRIYRSVGNGGPNSSKYLVKVINDNTTTTYLDNMDDVTLIAQAQGPIDNGIPPVAKYIKYYDQGMVYANGNQVWYQRPGSDLNSTMETIPALNTFLLPPAGDITGMFVFAFNLYIFQEQAITAAQWVNGNLIPRPVLKAKEALIGAIDQNCITAFGNEYLLFKDRLGQLQRMDAGENFKTVSKPIANILNDSNPYPVAASIYHQSWTTNAEFSQGTVGSNLAVGANGGVSYQYPSSGNSIGSIQTSFGTLVNVTNPGVGHDANGVRVYSEGQSVAGMQVVPDGQSASVFLKASASGVAFNGLFPSIGGNPGNNVFYALTIYKSVNGVRGALIGQLSSTQVPSLAQSFTGFSFPLNIYMPMGETVEVVISNTSGNGHSFFLLQATNGALGNMSQTNPSGPPLCMNINYFPAVIGHSFNISTVLPTAANLQRWAGITVASPLLRGGQSIQITIESSNNGFPAVDNTPNGALYAKTLVYDLEATSDNFGQGVNEPNFTLAQGIHGVRDYRGTGPFVDNGFGATAPLPAPSPQRQYFRYNITVNPNRLTSPVAITDTRVSTLVTDAFPSSGTVVFLASQQSSFPATYNPNDPTQMVNDVFLSDIVQATGIYSFGKFTTSFIQNQQNLVFLIRTGTNSTTILGNAWNVVAPNQPIPISAINNPGNDTVFQWAVLFHDNPGLQGVLPSNISAGTPSVVNSVSLSWQATASNILAPIMPPTLVHFKGMVVGSWTSDQHSVLDHTLYMDHYTLGYTGPLSSNSFIAEERFALWTGYHFGAFTVASNKLIGGPISGGILGRLFNSAIGDFNSSATQGANALIATVPDSGGTSNLKTLDGVHYGFEVNTFDKGVVQGSLSVWTPISGSALPPSFQWSVSTNPGGNPLNIGYYIPGIGLMDTFGQQPYAAELTHASINPAQAIYNVKPFQTEYFQEVGLQERAFVYAVRWYSYLDGAGINTPGGNKIFPALTGIGTEAFIENMRGV